MLEGGFLTPFLGAFQACLSVLLTMCYGVAARRLRLIQETSVNDMAGLGVKLFLPALIIVHLGEQLHAGIVMNYFPILGEAILLRLSETPQARTANLKIIDLPMYEVWSVIYISVSIGFAHVISRAFDLPAWVTPACAFNNTTSLPLILLQSLESVGSLKLIIQEGDTMSSAIARAQSYFLLCAVVSKSIGYAIGPKMLRNGEHLHEDEEHQEYSNGAEQDGPTCPSDPEHTNEETSLLHDRPQNIRRQVCGRFKHLGRYVSSFLPKRVKQELLAPFESPFTDVAILCTIIGATLGLVPSLHKAFFSPYEEGGIFNAWLTSSIQNIGKLFTTLQIFIVGCKLGVRFEMMEANGNYSRLIPLKAIATIFLIRLVIWPALSISIIYGLAKRTTLVRYDPILWFSMMLMPVGPPALVISGLAELAKISEMEKITITTTLTIMYALSPFICFSITGALKASEAALDARNS